jgi:hypothetical protein
MAFGFTMNQAMSEIEEMADAEFALKSRCPRLLFINSSPQHRAGLSSSYPFQLKKTLPTPS